MGVVSMCYDAQIGFQFHTIYHWPKASANLSGVIIGKKQQRGREGGSRRTKCFHHQERSCSGLE